MRFDIGGPSEQINVTNLAAFTGGSITLNLNTAEPDSNSYTLLTAGTLTGVLTLSTTKIGRTTFTLDLSTANAIKVNLTGNAADLIWIGADPANPGKWEANQIATNWNNTEDNSHNPDWFYSKDRVTFDESSSVFAVNVTGQVSPGEAIFKNSTHTYTLSGTGGISGNGTLTVQGSDSGTPGKVILNTSNSYTGGTRIKTARCSLATPMRSRPRHC